MAADVRLAEMLGSEQHVYFRLDATQAGSSVGAAEPSQCAVATVPTVALSHRDGCGPRFRAGQRGCRVLSYWGDGGYLVAENLRKTSCPGGRCCDNVQHDRAGAAG